MLDCSDLGNSKINYSNLWNSYERIFVNYKPDYRTYQFDI